MAFICPFICAQFGGSLLVTAHQERRRPKDYDSRGRRNLVFGTLAVLCTCQSGGTGRY